MTPGELLFKATRRPHQHGDWCRLTPDEQGHFERSARKLLANPEFRELALVAEEAERVDRRHPG